jgi:hypothetical protein
MSLFIAGLACDGVLLDQAKIGILAGSALSAALGSSLLLGSLAKQQKAASNGGGRQGTGCEEREAVWPSPG